MNSNGKYAYQIHKRILRCYSYFIGLHFRYKLKNIQAVTLSVKTIFGMSSTYKNKNMSFEKCSEIKFCDLKRYYNLLTQRVPFFIKNTELY
jgi:hypothetical protein